MWRGRFSKGATSPSVTRVLHVGIVACMLAMALLPLIGTGTVSAAEDAEPILLEQVDPNINLNDNDQFDLVDPEADPEEPEDVQPQDEGDGEGGETGDDDYVDPGYPQEPGAV